MHFRELEARLPGCCSTQQLLQSHRPRQDYGGCAQPPQLLYCTAQPIQLLYCTAQPVQLLYCTAQPAQQLYCTAQPVQLLYCTAQPVQQLYCTAQPIQLLTGTCSSNMADNCDEHDAAALKELVRLLQGELQTLQSLYRQQRDDHQHELQEVEQRLQEAMQSSRREEMSYLQTLLAFAEQERDTAQQALRRLPTDGAAAGGADAELPASYRRVVEALETELQLQAKRCRDWQQRYTQLQRLNKACNARVEQSETTRLSMDTSLRLQITELQRQNDELQQQNDELQQLQASHQQEYDLQTRNLQQLRGRERELREAVAAAGDKLKEGERKVEEGVKVATDAVVEKDAALLRERHLRDEVEQLTHELERIKSTVTEKSKEQINRSKDEHNRIIQNMSQDLAQTKQDYERVQAQKELLAERLQETRAELESNREGLQEDLQQLRHEAAELRQRISELTAQSSASAGREHAAREREEKLRELFCEQTSKQESQLQQLAEQLTVARADNEQAKLKLRAAERSLEAEKTYASDRRRADQNKIAQLEQYLDEKKKQREKLESQHQERLQQLRAEHEQTVAKLHSHVDEKQETCTRLLQERESISRALEVRLAAAEAQVTSTTALLADQKAHAMHYRKKLETASARLQECQQQLEEIESRNFDRI
ncbi:hypothetical protein FHG87_000503 [Trinorchestia longiramus]|nr:hypothetical protein FHG87_000503 [Trinorchestia longiramus]